MMRYWLLGMVVVLVVIGVFFINSDKVRLPFNSLQTPSSTQASPIPTASPYPLSIEAMRAKNYPGSDLTIEQTLSPGSNYSRYVASYKSEGLKIYGLLTIPTGVKPEGGWPIIMFNHGYIQPEVYRTTERYVAYQDAFAREGYVTFKSDYRGHGSSEGDPEGGYYSPAYTTDVLNGLASVQKLKDVNPDKIGFWGHSMGGNVTLRAMVINKQIKAGVIWGGVVGTYDDLLNHWDRAVPFQPSGRELALRQRFRAEIIKKYSTPQTNPQFWNSIDPNSYLQDISGPIQLHAGTEDEEVPWKFSQGLTDRLKATGKPVEFYPYEGADHNISSPSFEVAMKRSVDFFNKLLK